MGKNENEGDLYHSHYGSMGLVYQGGDYPWGILE